MVRQNGGAARVSVPCCPMVPSTSPSPPASGHVEVAGCWGPQPGEPGCQPPPALRTADAFRRPLPGLFWPVVSSRAPDLQPLGLYLNSMWEKPKAPVFCDHLFHNTHMYHEVGSLWWSDKRTGDNRWVTPTLGLAGWLPGMLAQMVGQAMC